MTFAVHGTTLFLRLLLAQKIHLTEIIFKIQKIRETPSALPTYALCSDLNIIQVCLLHNLKRGTAWKCEVLLL